MRYFDNTLKLRVPHTEKYRIHQLIDTLMQERLAIKLPYSWRALSYPDAPHHSVVQLRSSVELSMPGEKEKFLMMEPGAIIKFDCNICSEVRVYEKDNRVARTGNVDEVIAKLKSACTRKGFTILSATSEGDEIFQIKKPKNHSFVLGQHRMSVIARVQDESLSERGVVEGLGSKRIFGFGFLSNIEVL